MAANMDDINRWLENRPKDAKWMVVICDTFEYDDYPCYFSDPQACLNKIAAAQRGENMMRLMEVYDLEGDIEAQKQERRAMHPPISGKPA